MPKKPANLIWILTTALCVLVQGVGSAAGGVLCLGCTNLWGGVAVASAPCTSADDCCSEAPESKKAPADDHTDKSDHDCGCVDIKLSHHSGTVLRSSPKAVFPISFVILPAVFAVEQPNVPSTGVMRASRYGPPTVPLLSPTSRWTILHI